MAKAFPKELRERVVNAYESKLGTIDQVAEIFGIGARTLRKYLKIYRTTGDLTPIPHPGGGILILTEENLRIIKKIILSNTDGTLEEFRNEFLKETGIDVTIVTIHNACNILNLNRKKKAFLQQSKKEKTLK